jgi:hypothetical protein
VPTIEELLELENVRRLRLRYSQCYDAYDLEGLLALFADDATCSFSPPVSQPWVGKERLRAEYGGQFGRLADEPYRFLHSVTNLTVDLTSPRTASGQSYLIDMDTRTPPTGNPVTALALYTDTYAKTKDIWQIQTTGITFLWRKERSSQRGN